MMSHSSVAPAGNDKVSVTIKSPPSVTGEIVPDGNDTTPISAAVIR